MNDQEWAQAWERLAAAGRATTSDRGRQRPRIGDDTRARGTTFEAIVFHLGNARYAIETRLVREIFRLLDYTPVPGAPDFLVGVNNLRGESLAVADLRRFFGIAITTPTDLSRVIVLGHGEHELGVLADQTGEVAFLDIDQIRDLPSSTASAGREYVHGVTPDALIVLDGTRLLSMAQGVPWNK